MTMLLDFGRGMLNALTLGALDRRAARGPSQWKRIKR